MEEWLSVREATSAVAKALQRADTTDEAEAILVDFIPKFVEVDGVAIIRHIRHIGKTLMTHAYGVYKPYIHSYNNDDVGLTGYIVKHKVPLFINKKSDVPSSVKEVGTYEEGEHYAVIPLLDSNREVMLVVMAIKLDQPFSPKDITTLRSMVIQAGIIYEKIYLKTRMEKFRKASTLISEFIHKHTINPSFSILSLAEEVLSILSDTIKSTEAASILMKTEDGFRFIGCMKYENTLLDKPPIPEEQQIIWYGKGRNLWLRGVPRILSHDEILERDSVKYDEEKGKTIRDAQATLGIPVVIEGQVRYFFNLDNFSSPVPFDDVDIDIAMLIASAFAMAVEIGKTYNEIQAHQEILKALSSPPVDKKLLQEYSDETLKLIKDNLVKKLLIMTPDFIFGIHYPDKPHWTQIYPSQANSQMTSILNSIDTSSPEGQTYLPKEKLFISWFTRNIPDGYLKLLFIKRRFLPYGSWWQKALKLITDYYISLIKIIVHSNRTRLLSQAVAKNIGKLLEDLDLEPKGHMDFMGKWAPLMEKHILGKVSNELIYGAYIHDIGKILLSDRKHAGKDLNKHVVLGGALIDKVRLDHLKVLKNIILYHHERTMGGGPFGLQGPDIPREAEIVGMLCHLHHLISKGMTTEEAVRVIRSYSPSHYSILATETLKTVAEVLKNGD